MSAGMVTLRNRLALLRERLFRALAGSPWSVTALLALGAAVVGLSGGWAFAGSPWTVLGGLLGLLTLAAIVHDPRVALFAAVVVTALLPFGVVPLPLGGFQVTFLEITLGLALALWVVRAILAPEQRIHVSPPGALLLVFLGLTGVAFANGLAYGFAMADARQYLKGILAALAFFTVLNCLKDERDGRRLLAVFVAASALAGLVGIAIYLLPYETALGVLNSLGSLGYPTGADLLRFHVESERLRAVGTSVDPNAFGALMMLASVLVAGQLLAPVPLLCRRWLLVAAPILVAALLLSLSRSSWVGCAAGIAFVTILRYRRLWPLALVAVAGAAAVYAFGFETYLQRLPVVGSYVGHLFTGLRAEDQATLMRLGEYKDALRLVSTYPWFGVGYGNAPSAEFYVGVSSLYLLLAENAGLVGLGAYLLAVGATFAYSLRATLSRREAPLSGLALGALGAMAGALAAGIFDQPFINPRFASLAALFWMLAGSSVWSARLVKESTRDAREGVG
ncbi:MAG: O-antigen ligase family protein [Chloroflexota bacterium]